tara:strand:- start:2922 stop:3278 length:357 start_codon:yes stop_codon:yes gene_type:complete
MLRRRSGKEPEPKKDKTILILHGGKAMDMAAVLTLSTLITIGGTIIGFMLGWFANSYYLNYMEIVDGREETEEVKITAHPEMMDENGNPIPFQIAKLISVEFDEKDAFTRDPFTDLDD